MTERMNYDERIREAQTEGERGTLVYRNPYARTAANTIAIGDAFYRELVPSRGTPAVGDVLAKASPDAPEVLWETRGKTAHMLVAGSKLDDSLVGDGDALSAVGRTLVARALEYPTLWHVCWIDESATLRLWAEGNRPSFAGRVGGLYLEELGQDFSGEIAWDTDSATDLLRALTRASSEDAEKPPGEIGGKWFLEGRKNTLVIVERPRSHEVLSGIEKLIRTAASASTLPMHFGAGVHVVVLTESPGSLPLSFMRRFGQRLALPTTKAASRDVLGGSEAAAFPGALIKPRSSSGVRGASDEVLFIPAVLYDEARGGRDVLVPNTTKAAFEDGMEYLATWRETQQRRVTR